MTKQGCTKQVAYVDDFIVLLENALNFLLNKNYNKKYQHKKL